VKRKKNFVGEGKKTAVRTSGIRFGSGKEKKKLQTLHSKILYHTFKETVLNCPDMIEKQGQGYIEMRHAPKSGPEWTSKNLICFCTNPANGRRDRKF
jgi:hypothetical protein